MHNNCRRYNHKDSSEASGGRLLDLLQPNSSQDTPGNTCDSTACQAGAPALHLNDALQDVEDLSRITFIMNGEDMEDDEAAEGS